MPKIAKELSALAVDKLKKPGRYAVGGGAPGLCLRVTPNGARSWVLRVKIADKRYDMGLGSYPAVSLSEARTEAGIYRKQIRQGENPITARRQQRRENASKQSLVKTFKECAEAYIEAKSPEWKNPKHRQQWANTLEAYAYPVLSKMDVAAIDLPHVLEVLEPLWATKTETARRLRGRIESVLDWATVRRHRSGENPARWKGHLDTVLPQSAKVAKVQHHPAMPVSDTPAFWVELSGKQGMGARALQFAILTAARSGEVRGATWDEVDLSAAVWTIPAERMKAGKEHRVPLSKQAVSLLKALPRMVGSPYVFFAPRGGKLSDMSLTAAMRRMELPYVPHGFRSTFRDWIGDHTEYPRDLAEFALAHTIPSDVEAAYRRGSALERRRVMMQEWADYLSNETVRTNTRRAG